MDPKEKPARPPRTLGELKTGFFISVWLLGLAAATAMSPGADWRVVVSFAVPALYNLARSYSREHGFYGEPDEDGEAPVPATSRAYRRWHSRPGASAPPQLLFGLLAAAALWVTAREITSGSLAEAWTAGAVGGYLLSLLFKADAPLPSRRTPGAAPADGGATLPAGSETLAGTPAHAGKEPARAER